MARTDYELNREIAVLLGWPVHDWEWTTAAHPLMGKAAHCLVRNYDPLEEERRAALDALAPSMSNDDPRFDSWMAGHAAIREYFPYPDYKANHPTAKCIPRQEDIADWVVPKWAQSVGALSEIEDTFHAKHFHMEVTR